MDKHAILSRLPSECPSNVEDYTYGHYLQELGGHMAIYKRVRYQAGPELRPLMCPDDFDNVPPPTWAAECTCTCCGESWHTAWSGGPMKAIVIMVGEDGLHYPVTSLDDSDVGPYLVELSSNDGILCPVCGENVTLIHASRIKSGTTRRLAMCSVENIGEYTGLFYWLAYWHMDADGLVYKEISPWWAFLLDENSKLHSFHYSRKAWRASRDLGDPFFAKYVSGDGDLYNFRKGGFVCEWVPSLIGYTGEKTGLGEYVRQGGTWPLLYLKTWKKHPAIENLVNAGWAPLIEAMFNRVTHYGEQEVAGAELPSINWSSARPHEMLFMDKTAFRRLGTDDNDRRRYEWYEAWKGYLAAGGKLDAYEFDRYWCKYTQYGMNTALEVMTMQPGLDLPKITKYLGKQGFRPTEVRILADTWRMTTILTGRDVLSQEELWPRYLLERHDRLSALYQSEKQKNASLIYLEGFRRIVDKYGDLQWSDGELDIILPKDNGELVREGDVLRHCVGTYGASHVSESQTIFFVRRHRRPERCYYTLAMNMTGEPRRVQLHGYGNERHGPNKQYRHSIPKKVLDFCDRWEREIVLPWWRDQKKKEGKTA